MVRSTFAAELLSLLDAVKQDNVIRIALDEVHVGAQTSRQLIDKALQSIYMDAGVYEKSVFDSVTAEVVKTPNDKQFMLHAKAFR